MSSNYTPVRVAVGKEVTVGIVIGKLLSFNEERRILRLGYMSDFIKFMRRYVCDITCCL
jgi:RNase P/RNase MRP subunit p30